MSDLDNKLREILGDLRESKAANTRIMPETILAIKQAFTEDTSTTNNQDDQLKMYVWEDVLRDYTSGLVCILAHNLEEALAQARKEFESYIVEGFAGRQYQVYDTPKAVYVYGGG